MVMNNEQCKIIYEVEMEMLKEQNKTFKIII